MTCKLVILNGVTYQIKLEAVETKFVEGQKGNQKILTRGVHCMQPKSDGGYCQNHVQTGFTTCWRHLGGNRSVGKPILNGKRCNQSKMDGTRTKCQMWCVTGKDACRWHLGYEEDSDYECNSETEDEETEYEDEETYNVL